MKMTPEQQEQVRKAKAAGEQRTTLQFTDDQRGKWKSAVEQELSGKDGNIDHLLKIRVEAEKPGFFGDVRRAIVVSRHPVAEIADEIGVDVCLLSDFRAGDADLPAAAIDRLIEILGLRLMQEIPR